MTTKAKARLGLTLIITLLVVSLPIVMLINPGFVAASPSSDGSASAPSTISQDGSEFIAQDVICCLKATTSNNIVTTNSFYDIVFLTATAGTIDRIEVVFPAGTTIADGGFFHEAEKCVRGGDCTMLTGTASKSGQTITYIVANAENVPVGTKIRLEFANINNPLNPSANYQVTVTTRDASNNIIDGPTQSTPYTIKQIGKNVIADGHITTPKIANDAITPNKVASSFAYKRILSDGESGWNPDGVAISFSISDLLFDVGQSIVLVNLDGGDTIATCGVSDVAFQEFTVTCDGPPPDGAQLRYTVFNPSIP